jgi:putative endonuclease
MTGKQPSVYILASYRRVLYVGVTADLARRLDAHRRKLNPNSFTARYNVTQLEYVERHATMPAAIAREKQI